MKVLLIWEEIPERTKLYSLEGDLAELAIKCAGQYIGGSENNSPEIIELNEKITDLPLFGSGEDTIAFKIITTLTHVVIAGIIL
jgi:hypothetical protein